MTDLSVNFNSDMKMSEALQIIETRLKDGMKHELYTFGECETISKSIQTVYKVLAHYKETNDKLTEQLTQKTNFIEEYKSLLVDKNKTIIETSEKLDKSVEEVMRLTNENQELKNDLRELCEEPEPEPVSEKKKGKRPKK